MKLDGLMMTRQKFSKNIERVVKTKRISYLEAIIVVCEESGLEPEDVKKYISPAIRTKMEAEAIKLNLMKEKNRSGVLE